MRRPGCGPLARVLLPLAVPAVAACTEQIPTAVESGELFPVTARTVEIRVPAADFLRSVRLLDGFGSPADLGYGLVARGFEGKLNALTLARFSAYPRSASVVDSTGTTRVDSVLTLLGGSLLVRIDTTTVVGSPPVRLAAGALMQPWHAGSTTWANAVDTLGTAREWQEPGAGPVIAVGQGSWTAAAGDSVVIAVDSATVAAWGDTARAERSVRIGAETQGVRVQIRSVALRLLARPSVRRDTTLVLSVGTDALTFIYDPPPEAPSGELRVGGAPAWRSILVLDVPREFAGGHPVCARVACPLRVDSANLTFAALVLRSQAMLSAHRPVETVRLELRPVLRPERLPKAPLGAPVDPGLFGEPGSPPILPSAFVPGAKALVIAVPLTTFVRDHLRGATADGNPPSNTLALLVAGGLEPRDFGIVTFSGTGPDAPELRLVITVTQRVGLP